MKSKHLLLAVLALCPSLALAEINVVLDDFENMNVNPWGYAANVQVKPTDDAHGGKSAAEIRISSSGENLGLLRPIDIPEGITRLTAWIKGSPGAGMGLQAVFKDRQGFAWYGGTLDVNQSGWQEMSCDIQADKLKPGWQLGWWKNNDKAKTLKFEMTFPLRFVGFKINGPGGKTATIVIDDLALTAETDKPYVHVPRSVVTVPHDSGFPVVVVAGAKVVKGKLTVEAVSRNDTPLTGAAVTIDVDVPAGQTREYKTNVKLSKTGLYRLKISGPGIAATDKQVQAVSAMMGVEAFDAIDRLARPFSTSIANSPKQTHRKAWLNDSNKPMVMYVSELSPAWLLRNNSTNGYMAFAGLKRWGLGAPSYMAIPTANGARVVKNGQTLRGTQLAGMNRGWVLVWFDGANGWTDWDAPYLISLQHKPTRIALDADGLKMEFATKAGYMAIMPLYGGYKPPQAGRLQFVNQGLAPKDVLPFQWKSGLPKDVIDRCDWWSAVCKAYPVNCDEQFRVDPATDELIVQSKFEYILIEDDWKTKPIKFAPIPYVLGTCIWGKTFPVKFDQEVHDPMLPSCYGPYMGIENADGYTYRMHVLQYIHEAQDVQVPSVKSPVIQAAVDQISNYATTTALNAGELEYHPEANMVWGMYGGHRFRSSDLLYTDHAGVRLAGQLTNQRFFLTQLFWRGQYEEADVGFERKFLYFPGPGFGFQGDAGKITTDAYYTAWLYGYATGDYQLLADKWDDVVSRLNCLPFTMCWARVGRDAIAEGGDEAPPPLGMARVAWAIGDMDTYAYSCYLFARELTHHYVKVGVGADYFRAFQPIGPLVNKDWKGSNEWPKAGPIPQRANVTNMFGESAGWILGGPPDDKRLYDPSIWQANVPLYGQKRQDIADVIPWSYFGSGQWVQKWSRFDAEDVFRFYADNALEQCRKEFDTWLKVEFPGLPKKYPVLKRGGQDGYPSTPWRLMQLRADILGESADQIGKLYPPANWAACDQTFYQAMIRAAGDRKLVRLIPKTAPASPFQPGVQRDFVGNPSWDNPVQTPAGIVSDNQNDRTFNWPVPCYFMARPPRIPGDAGTGTRWSFGAIMPNTNPRPQSVKKETINWVTDYYEFE